MSSSTLIAPRGGLPPRIDTARTARYRKLTGTSFWVLTLAGSFVLGLSLYRASDRARVLSTTVFGSGVLGWAGIALSRQRRELRRQKAELDRLTEAAAELAARREHLTRALTESEGRFHLLTDGMKDYAFFLVNAAGQIVTWDDRSERLYGYSAAELLGQPLARLFPLEDAAEGLPPRQLERALTEGKVEDRAWRVRKDGKRIWANVTLAPLRHPDGQPHSVLILTRDLTGQRQAEETLRATRGQYRQLTETARDVVLTLSLDGRITSLNPAFDQLTGWRRLDWIGRPFKPLLHEEDQAQAAELLLSFSQVNAPPVFELRVLTAAQDYTPMEFTATAQLTQGKVSGWLCLARDVAERRKTEAALRQTEEQLRQSQKMEAIGRLAGGLGHDFNNLLTIINGYTEIVRERIGPNDPTGELLVEVQRAGERAAGLTRQLLAFSRKQVLQPQVVNLNVLVADTAKMLRRLIKEDIDLSIVLADNCHPVRIDPGQIEQVLFNLAVNARDAMPCGGKLTIETRNTVLTAERLPAAPDVRPGPYTVLSMRDSGFGMTEAVKVRVFEPFFTTKPLGKGTGLGLATVYGIIKQSDGHIEVESKPGRGSTFTVYLPQVESAVVPHATRQEVRTQARGTETVLVVEDEDGVRSLARRALEQCGYRVLEANNGVAALALCEQHQGSLDLLVTDVVMPGMGGPTLARRVTKLHACCKVLYISGHTDSTLVHHGLASEDINYLNKPFTAGELTLRVRQLLDVSSQHGSEALPALP